MFSLAVIRAYIDHDLISEIDLSDRLPSTNYKVNVFDYNITARLNITWYDYPEQNFEYNLRVDGTCGNEECAGDGSCNCLGICSVPNNPPYECSWQNDFIADESETVTGAGSGTTEIYDGSYIQLPPSNNLEDTSWQVECRDGSFSENCGQSPGPDGSQVQLTMRTSCDNYAHTPWIEEEIPKANLQVCTNDIFPGCDGINDFYITFDAFDSESLNYGYKKYGGPSGLDGGGIYKNGVYQSYDSDALWDGDAGIVVILNYNSQATYLINRLPANGPILCAYTDYIIQNFEINEYDETISGTDIFGNPVECSYDNKYSIIYHLGDMATIFPDYHQTCSGKNDCTATFIVPSHLFTDNDQTDYLNFHITYRPPHKELTLNVTTDLAELDNLYSVSSIDFSEFGGLTVSNSGEHILRFIIEDGGDIIASSSVRYTSCTDSDNDGFCSIEENGNDCNDADETINPEAQELCDGIDNNCIGGIDDGFDLGAECYIGSTEIINGHVASICMGEIVCMEDGSNSMCQTFVKPGDSEEICNNTYDDDCDGLVDEDDNMWIDGIWQNCTMPCRDGDPCGTDSGTCQFGVKHCYQNQSYDCIGGESPCGGTWDELIYGCEETRCNRVDEDCDGIIDNIGGATSASDAHCWCFGGTSPRSESDEPCNDMDDDCDGYIDEGLVCCEAGQTRQCGETDVGECSYGTQTCTSYGSWDSTCVGEISPVQEICYDNKDNDCDGEIDDYEICNPDVTCFNGIWDINEEGTDCGGVCDQPCKEGDSTMILIIVIVVVVAAVFILFKYKKKLFGKKVDKRRESYQRPKRRPWYMPRY